MDNKMMCQKLKSRIIDAYFVSVWNFLVSVHVVVIYAGPYETIL